MGNFILLVANEQESNYLLLALHWFGFILCIGAAVLYHQDRGPPPIQEGDPYDNYRNLPPGPYPNQRNLGQQFQQLPSTWPSAGREQPFRGTRSDLGVRGMPPPRQQFRQAQSQVRFSDNA